MDSLLRKYTVAWICPLAIERAAAESMLSEMHEAPTQTLGDDNIYTFGAIGGHNVVIAGLSDQGLTAANTVALQMLRTFGEGLRLRMLVGIGGGIPGRGRDIRLGDVVISKPDGTSGGVIQTDRGKQEHDGFRRTGQLNRPPRAMLQALEKLMATHERCEPMMKSYIAEALEKNERMRPHYRIPSSKDVLFHPNYTHKDQDRECTACCSINGENCVFEQEPRTEPQLWLGNIASSNAVMKNGKMRDQALQEFDVLCFEMEAAGLMNDGFSCLVIRGIADYADSHKSKEWQRYAALTAAACAKELLLQVPPSPVPDTIDIHSIAFSTTASRPSPGIIERLVHDLDNVQQFLAQLSDSPDTGRRLAQLTGQQQGPATHFPDRGGLLSGESRDASAISRAGNTRRTTATSVSHVHFSGSLETPCPDRCRCACHGRRRFTYGNQARILGSLSLSIAGVGWFRPKCTLNTCKRASNGGFAFQYTFPLWLMNRMLAAWIHGAPAEDGMRLKYYRVFRSDCITFAEMGRVEEMRELYQSRQAYVNDADPADGETALMAAIRTKQVGVVEFLLNNGADRYQPDNAGFTPGDYALCAIYGTTTADSNHACDALTAKFDMTEVLEDQNFNSLHRIVLGISGRDLAAEADEHPELINKVDAQGRSALYWATWRSDVDRVKVLLEAGADGTLRDMEGQTALHLTANTGSAEIARLLLQSDTCGALTCLNLQNNSGYCPWHIAVVHGCEAVLAELLQHACDFRLRTNLGRSILHLAMRFGSLSAAQHLLKVAPFGASAEPDHSGKTAADYLDEFHEGHPSVLSRDSETVKALGALLDAATVL